MKGKRLLINTAILSATSLILKTLGLMFQVMLSKRIGAAGIGLFQLIMSVNSFAATLSISGIRFATTRLVSEELGKGTEGNIPHVVKKCLAYAIICGLIAGFGLYFSSIYVGVNIIGDERACLSLQILGVSMPFLSAGAALGGYFTGVSRIGKSVVASLTEQVSMIAVSLTMLSLVPEDDLSLMCASVSVGFVAGEAISFFVIYFLYLHDKRKYKAAKSSPNSHIVRRMFNIAVPLAISAYARTALNTIQNILIPKGFQKSGASSETALADYGMIQGMVFPIVTYPAVIFSAVSELIVPELTEEQVKGRNSAIAVTANLLLKLCLLFSMGVMGVFICFSRQFGMVIYESNEIGGFIKLFALLMPIMYMDTITDGMLRGLGQQLYSMQINIIDSLLCTVLIYVLLPKYAIYGYIFILYASEIFNFSLSIHKLHKLTKINDLTPYILKATLSVIGAVNLTEFLFKFFRVNTGIMSLILGIGVMMCIYIMLILATNTISKKEVKILISAMK
jgi:stage V sporulation protein B